MKVHCQHVWMYISDYIDREMDPVAREEVEAHLAVCEICSAVLDSTRNVLYLTADDRTFALPVGFSERLHERLDVAFADIDAGFGGTELR